MTDLKQQLRSLHQSIQSYLELSKRDDFRISPKVLFNIDNRLKNIVTDLNKGELK